MKTVPFHVTPPGHPEQVARLEYVRRALASDRICRLKNGVEAPLA